MVIYSEIKNTKSVVGREIIEISILNFWLEEAKERDWFFGRGRRRECDGMCQMAMEG